VASAPAPAREQAIPSLAAIPRRTSGGRSVPWLDDWAPRGPRQITRGAARRCPTRTSHEDLVEHSAGTAWLVRCSAAAGLGLPSTLGASRPTAGSLSERRRHVRIERRDDGRSRLRHAIAGTNAVRVVSVIRAGYYLLTKRSLNTSKNTQRMNLSSTAFSAPTEGADSNPTTPGSLTFDCGRPTGYLDRPRVYLRVTSSSGPNIPSDHAGAPSFDQDSSVDDRLRAHPDKWSTFPGRGRARAEDTRSGPRAGELRPSRVTAN
jgi:hypothetical protein